MVSLDIRPGVVLQARDQTLLTLSDNDTRPVSEQSDRPAAGRVGGRHSQARPGQSVDDILVFFHQRNIHTSTPHHTTPTLPRHDTEIPRVTTRQFSTSRQRRADYGITWYNLVVLWCWNISDLTPHCYHTPSIPLETLWLEKYLGNIGGELSQCPSARPAVTANPRCGVSSRAGREKLVPVQWWVPPTSQPALTGQPGQGLR